MYYSDNMQLMKDKMQRLLPYGQSEKAVPVSVFSRFVSGLGLKEALQKTAAADKTIASSCTLSRLMLYSREWMKMKCAFPCMTGTMAAYKKPDAPFGSSIEFVDGLTNLTYVFIVPDDYKNFTNTMLLVEHPYFSLEVDGNRRIINPIPSRVVALENFPATDGFYRANGYDVPVGMQMPYNDLSVLNYGVHTDAVSGKNLGLRYLKRTSRYVGPVIRSLENPRCIDLTCPPSMQFGIIVNDS
jgi:hypothetical protein